MQGSLFLVVKIIDDMIASVIILAKNSTTWVKTTFETVCTQRICGDKEVIVIDSGSRDFTLAIIKKYPVRLHRIPANEFGHGRRRNLGAQMARGDYVVFLNQDAQPEDEQWLSGLLNGFSNTVNIAAVYSKIVPGIKCNPLDKRDILRDFPIWPKKKGRLPGFHTTSCAIHRDLLLQYPFAE
jgi:rhamnosyltransferase